MNQPLQYSSPFARPIPGSPSDFDIAKIRAWPIVENGAPLVPASLAPDRILIHPRYFLENLPSALPECFVRAAVLERLLDAAERLPSGYRLVLFDAWRSNRLQTWLFERCVEQFAEQDPETAESRARSFVAWPMQDADHPPFHLTGGAVDLSIVDDRGRLLDMGTEFDATTKASSTCYYELATEDEQSQRIRTHRRLLYHAMTEAGFANLPSEWWHYAYGDQLWAWSYGQPCAHYGATAPRHRWSPIG